MLKEFGYNITTTFDEAKECKEIIALADSQMLRTIRDITKHNIEYNKLERLYTERKICQKHLLRLKTKDFGKYKNKLNIIKQKNTLAYKNIFDLVNNTRNIYSDRIDEIQNKINKTMFIPNYITVVIEHNKHYEYLYQNGFTVTINNVTRHYKRISCSAGQARVSTVAFCSDDIIDEVKCRINNGRKLDKPIASSKFNSYFGLSGSASKIVSEPKFIVVKDFSNTTHFKANYVTETDWDKDDIITVKDTGDMEMNRTDGMGLISPRQAKKWAEELGLDYIPSQYGIRQSFIKGMLCVFDIHDFCKKMNHGNYIVDTIYKDGNGNYIKADLRDYDVIISESQFKLWDSFNSVDEYIDNCHKNKLYWSVPQYAPKEAKNMLKLNYQFIQTLDLKQKDVENLCKQFVDWIEGVSYKNVPYMLLFLLGVNNDKQKIEEFLRSGQNYWIKSLIVNPELKNDKYIRTKIRELIKKKIQNGCIGDIYVDGNFQIIVSDPFGFMQHVCGQKVTGLLGNGQFYSNYWNERGVKQVDAMRSPLTYKSEHVILNLRNDDCVNYWYKYCKLGIILNYYGHECVNFAGSDFDLDILATTSNRTMIEHTYKDSLPVVYDAPKPKKIVFTEDDLYKSDTFSFGSIIGSITNKSSNAYALLPNLELKYGKNSDEYKLTESRLQQCCKAQSAQIDKAKIGKPVKGIPSIWVNKQEINIDKDTGEVLDSDDVVKEKNFYNNILLNKYPYFFKYRYKEAKKKFDKYVDENEMTCHQKFKMSVKSLMDLSRKTPEQKQFIKRYYDYMPLTYSDSSMNLLCRYIESINFDISQKIKSVDNANIINIYKNNNFQYTTKQYDDIVSTLQSHIKGKRFDQMIPNDEDESKYSDDTIKEYNVDNDSLENKIKKICDNPYIVVNCLVDYFYEHKISANKDILWSTYGKYMFNNVKQNTHNKIMFPLPDKTGNINYMGGQYSLKEVELQ